MHVGKKSMPHEKNIVWQAKRSVAHTKVEPISELSISCAR